MIIEDYSQVYFELLKGRTTPAVYEGKFVHITGPRDDFLILAPTQLCKYHAHIVARFCSLRDDVSFVSAGDDGRITTRGWTVRGGGRFQLDRSRQTLTLWGASKAYGPFNGEAIRDKLRGTSGWNEFELQLAEPV